MIYYSSSDAQMELPIDTTAAFLRVADRDVVVFQAARLVEWLNFVDNFVVLADIRIVLKLLASPSHDLASSSHLISRFLLGVHEVVWICYGDRLDESAVFIGHRQRLC